MSMCSFLHIFWWCLDFSMHMYACIYVCVCIYINFSVPLCNALFFKHVQQVKHNGLHDNMILKEAWNLLVFIFLLFLPCLRYLGLPRGRFQDMHASCIQVLVSLFSLYHQTGCHVHSMQ